VALVLALSVVSSAAEELPVCVVFDIDHAGWERVTQLKELPGVDWWLELDRELVACGSAELASPAEGHGVIRVSRHLDPLRLRLARGFTVEGLLDLGADVLSRGGGHALLYFSGPAPPAVIEHEHDKDGRDWRQLIGVTPDSVLVRQVANRFSRGRTTIHEEVGDLVDDVDPQRWFGDIVTLASFNRYTLGPDIELARDWLVQQFQSLPGLEVRTTSFPVYDVTAYNVIATMPGTTRPDDWYIVGGHYDATSEDPYVAAPGAEDNASGCAGVLELARVLSFYPQEGTVMFICYAGEEQGLWGSDDHAGDLVAAGDADKVQAMLNMDMIGYTSDDDLDCLLETEPPGQFLLDLFSDVAEQYTTLRVVTSTYAWGSDHVPYLERGMPALLTIENDWDEYPDYHRTTDLPASITLEMGGEILRMNVAAMAHLIGTDSGVLFRDGFEPGGVLDWGGGSK